MRIMRRFLSFLIVSFLTLGSMVVPSAKAAYDDTECLDLTDGTFCLLAENTNNNTINISNTISWTNRNRTDIPQISCEITSPRGIILPRNNCDNFINQDGYGDYRIYVTFNNDQATFVYNSNTRRFTSAVE